MSPAVGQTQIVKRRRKKNTLCSVKQRDVSHCGLGIYMEKSILRQKKKDYGNPNISPCKKKSSKKFSQRNQNPSRYYLCN